MLTWETWGGLRLAVREGSGRVPEPWDSEAAPLGHGRWTRGAVARPRAASGSVRTRGSGQFPRGTLWKGPQRRGRGLAGFLWGFAPPQGCAQGSGTRSRVPQVRTPRRGPAARIGEDATKSQSRRPRRAGGFAGGTARPPPSAPAGRGSEDLEPPFVGVAGPGAPEVGCQHGDAPARWGKGGKAQGAQRRERLGDTRDAGRGAWRDGVVIPVLTVSRPVCLSGNDNNKKGESKRPPHL